MSRLLRTFLARFIRGCLLAVWLLSGAMPGRATWYSENIENGADIIMMDLRWPWWPSGSYFANWNSSFNPKPNNISFYAGFTSFLADGPGQTPNPDVVRQDGFRPGSVWTFWGGDANGAPVRFIDVAPNLFIKNDYGGEGSSGTVGGEVWPFVQRQRWYTMLGRVWQNRGEAYIGRWVKDHADGRWHLIGVARLPIPATSFTGNSGFLEPLGSEKAVRSLHRRLGYFRKDGRWRKSDTISIDKTQYVVVNTVPEGGHEYAAIEYAQRPDLLPRALSGKPISGDRKHAFTTRQPELPTLDRPAIGAATAIWAAGHVVVSWVIPPTASPALGCRVELFDDSRGEGAPTLVREERIASLRDLLLPSAKVPGAVRLTVMDVFDQASAPVLLRPQVVPVMPAAGGASPAEATLSGLSYELFQKDTKRQVNYFNPPLQKPDEQHTWLTLDELSQGRLVRGGLARGFDIGLRENRSGGYAFRFKGLLRVAADGPHVLRAQIDGAYAIRLGGREILAWDGQHGTTEKAAPVVLGRGDHALEVTHVYDALPARNFSIDWEGPGFARQPIPLEALRVPEAGAYPVPGLDAATTGDGGARVEVGVQANGHTVERTALFLGALQLAEQAGPKVAYRGPLAAGTNLFWARVYFDGNRTVDSAPRSVVVTGPPAGPDWTVRNVGDQRASAGLWETGPGAFEFFGEGMHTVTRKVVGDFTATCRIAGYNGARGEPVNPNAWVGLTAREHGERLDWNWGRDFHLLQTAANGLRASADFTDFGGGRVTSYRLPKDRPWLRIMRQGDIWTAWTSEDGRHWELGAYQFKKMASRLDCGLFFSALPQQARAHYHASVADFSLVAGAAGDSPVPAPVAARGTEGDRFTGLAVARSDANTVVLRSPHAGLRRSRDGGRTWADANGGLAGDDLAVRSVAIHPANPEVMVRAGGRGTVGRLLKTVDGGRTWLPLAVEADFDGVGPSALCGEVLAFDLRDPSILYVGSESRGFLKSPDGGTTWTNLGVRGERITSVVVWPWESHYPAPAKGRTHLCVTTSPDRWMPLLGRGSPGVTTTALTSRAYVSHDGVKSLAISDERPDTGFFNVAFDKALQSVNEMRYATAHGYQSQVFAGWHMALYPPAKKLEWFRPFTAVGASAQGEQKFGRFFAQAIDPEQPGRYSVSERWAFEWSWMEPRGDRPAGGLIACAGDVHLGQVWYFLHTDGLYRSADGGRTLARLGVAP